MIKRLLGCVREYKKATILTPSYVAMEVVLECILPFVMAKLINSIGTTKMEPILYYGGILVVLAFASLFCGVMSAINAAIASAGFAKNLRHDLFYKVQSFGFSDIDAFSVSSLVTRMTTDVTNVQNAFQMVIRIAVRTPLMLIFSVVMSMLINVKMSLIFIGIIPVLGIVAFFLIRKVIGIFKRIFKKYDAMNNSVQENVAGIRVVKSFVREDYEKKKFGATAEEVRFDFTYAEKIIALNQPIMMFCIYTAMLLVSFLGAKLIIASGGTVLSTGELSSLITYGIQILSSMMMLSMVFVMMSMAEESANRISEVLDHESHLISPENGKTEVANGSIEFENVSFKYNEKSKKPALSDITLSIPSGTTVGIIGGTGSSKTSLIQLINRLYDVTEGSVKVGGVDVRDYDLESLRDAVSVVLQKNVLFSGTIKDNLRWGNPGASDEDMKRVCRLAQAEEFIEQFPDGYDTVIERGGVNVSGGQKQRLCIARALLKKPKILILDDSTSAVDTKTDALIRSAFKKEIPETTKLIIAQRVASVQDADMILVMEGGMIAEQGTHEELLEKKGIYYEVFQSQTKGKEAV
ncbi:MAG: ABC transporter ATP-binding protein/permease [Lachnospiraceae bacterium]|nr:ABC transporter ATP-binding protein/permease [Lachnospiraceae bacterium]